MSDPSDPSDGTPPSLQNGSVPPDAGGPADLTIRRDRPSRGRTGRRWSVFALLAAVLALGATGGAYLLDRSDAVELASASESVPEPTTPLVSARRVPSWTTELTAKRSIVAALEPVAAAAPPQTCIGVGLGAETVYSSNGSAPLTPASNQKLLTAAAALDILGSDTRLATEFRVAQAPVDGVVTGNLWMVGGGDPLLTSDARAGQPGDSERPQTDLEAVADQIVAQGVRQVTGSVIGDDSRHETLRLLPGWPERWLAGGTVAPLSALLANDGWQVDPTTGEGPGGATADPPAHAAAVMTQLLSERGVEILGPPASGAAPGGAESLLSVPSLTVGELTDQLLTFSDNTTAELLLREVGLAAAGEGSTAAGAAVVADWAASKGLPMEGTAVIDGSGLSSGNQVTCELLASILRADGPDGPLAGGLAVPGEPGTLDDRFGGQGLAVGSESEPGEWSNRLRAKTGTLNDVTALSGWILTRPGATLDFQVVTNTDGRQVTETDIEFQARVLTTLLDQPVAPPLQEAGPLPPSGA